MKFPIKRAYKLAQKLKRFKSELIITCHSEENPAAEEHMREVSKNVNWEAYDELIKELEYAYRINNHLP